MAAIVCRDAARLQRQGSPDRAQELRDLGRARLARVRLRARALNNGLGNLVELALRHAQLTQASEARGAGELLGARGRVVDAERLAEAGDRLADDGSLKRSAGGRQSAFAAPCAIP